MDVRNVIIARWRPFRRCWSGMYRICMADHQVRASVLLALVWNIAVLVSTQVRVCAVVAREPAAELADQHDGLGDYDELDLQSLRNHNNRRELARHEQTGNSQRRQRSPDSRSSRGT